MITIVDYGMGNLRSVQKGFEKVHAEARISNAPEEIATAEKLVLPGVGAFRDAISELRRLNLVEPLLAAIAKDRPFLGICLGLQLLFDVGYEDGEHRGLGVIPGEVRRFESAPGFKVPHMGWNTLDVVHPNPLLAGLPDPPSVYFVHSYHVVPADSSVIATQTTYGKPFVSMVSRGRLFAMQFHPEKSQRVGLKLLENFANLPA